MITTQLVLWLLYFFYDWIIRVNIIEYPRYAKLELNATLVRVPLLALSTYGIFHLVRTSAFLRRHRIGLLVVVVLLIIFSGLFNRAMTYLLVYCRNTNSSPTLEYAFRDLSKTIVSIVNGFFVMCVAALGYFNYQLQQQAQLTEQLKTANKEAELQLLKSQIKPHFIFNTLNNIYSLAVLGAASTAEMLLQLSNILGFLVYKSHQTTISLKEEMAYIESYLALEKIRYGNRLDVLIQEDAATEGFAIPPLLFLPLVENCITHGASKERGTSWIRLAVVIKEDIHIQIENSKPSEAPNLKKGGGIGLQNVRQRLQLIYGNHFTLVIDEEDYSFLVDLRLPKILPAHEA